MRHIGWTIILACVVSGSIQGETPYHDLDAPPHLYHQRIPQDRFSRLKRDLESGSTHGLAADKGEKEFLLALLKALDIPTTSQMWVFSTTSLQLSLISPSNPRALFFNEDTYVGYIPGGRIEVISIDPELGGIFYIFDIPREGQPARPERSGRCMNCHANEDTGQVPGLLAKSVIPGPGGGSLTAFRIGVTGHSIPFKERFGGWFVTGLGGITNHVGNLVGRLSAQGLAMTPRPPEGAFNASHYPEPTSDALAQLLHEHQVGFVNRVVEASYRARTLMHSSKGILTGSQDAELESQAAILVRYLLFAEEAAVPPNQILAQSAFKKDFLKNRRVGPRGRSLKDLSLESRLMRHRCSYMIYTPLFTGMPEVILGKVYRRLSKALAPGGTEAESASLQAEEKEAIREILRETAPAIPRGLFP